MTDRELLLSYQDKYYRFYCKYYDCPCNQKGICKTKYTDLPIDLLHEWDGKNIIKCLCG